MCNCYNKLHDKQQQQLMCRVVVKKNMMMIPAGPGNDGCALRTTSIITV